jgi:hypothetical protein
MPVHKPTKCITEVPNCCSGLTIGPNGYRPVIRDDVTYLRGIRLPPRAAPFHPATPSSSPSLSGDSLSTPPPLLLLVVQQESLAIFLSSSSSRHGELLLELELSGCGAFRATGAGELGSTAALAEVGDGGGEALADGISEEAGYSLSPLPRQRGNA